MPTRNRTLFLILSIVAAIGGCETIPSRWVRPGATQQELWNDRSFCIQKSDRLAIAGAGSNSSGRALLGLIASNNSFVDCMEELGWQPESESLSEETARIEVSGNGDEEIISECQQATSEIKQRMRITYRSTSHCSIGIWSGDGTKILRLSNSARQVGLRSGDTVIRIGFAVNPTADDIVNQIRNRGPHDTIDITVERNSENTVITAACEDGLPASRQLIAAFDAASEGRWADCIFRAHKYEQAIGYTSSGSASLRGLCDECPRLLANRPVGAADADLWYEVANLNLEEARLSRSLSQDLRDALIEVSALLRDSGFDLYANDIDTMLAQVAAELDSGEQPSSFIGGIVNE